MSRATIERSDYPDQPRHGARGVHKTNKKEHPQTPTPNAENVKRKPIRNPPDLENPEKRKSIESSGDGKNSYPRLHLEIYLRYVGPPVQTR